MKRVLLACLFLAFLAGCASLPLGAKDPRTPSHALVHPEETRLGARFIEAAHQHAGNSGYRMLSAGVDGLLTRLETIDAAERTVDLQYYIFHEDETGKLVSAALLRAADRGVKIRILVDDGETIPGDEQLFTLDGQHGIEVRVFNPFAYRGHNRAVRAAEYLFRHPRLDYRMHNKLLIADNAVALIGGRNIGAQYFQVDPDSQFADDDLFVVGPLSQQLSAGFDEFWNSVFAIPAASLAHRRLPHGPPADKPSERADRTPQGIRDTDYAQRLAAGEPFKAMTSEALSLSWAHAQVLFESPDKKRARNRGAIGCLTFAPLADAVRDTQTELLMVTPYFVPTQAESKLLTDLRARGVRVRILTNSLESAPELSAHSGYVRARLRLLKVGVEFHEVRSLLGSTQGSGQTRKLSRFGNYALHAKLYVFDRRQVVIGSMNFDQRSNWLNTEDGLIIESPAIAQQVAARFEAMTSLENAYSVSLGAAAAEKSPRLLWKTIENGRTAEYDREPARSTWQKFKVRVLSLVPLDREL